MFEEMILAIPKICTSNKSFLKAKLLTNIFLYREMSVLIAPGNKSVLGENGLVIVGGVLNLKDHRASDSTQ